MSRIHHNEMENIEVILDYNASSHNGIGYLGHRLVAFRSHGKSIITREITLAESLIWMEKMLVAGDEGDERLADCDHGPAESRWYRDLRAALK